MKKSAAKAVGKTAVDDSSVVIDPYLPQNGNIGFCISHYDLDLEYKMSSNRLSGTAMITSTAVIELSHFSLDFSTALKISKVIVNGVRPAKFSHAKGKLTIWLSQELHPGMGLQVLVKYAGTPQPISGIWGEVGFEELTEGVLVASQPNGAASWYPCNDHPSSKAQYRISITTDTPYRAIANGNLLERRVRAAQTTWTYEQSEPMSSYLATLQIGRYEVRDTPSSSVPMHAMVPARLQENFTHDFARQPHMMDVFEKLFGPYPFQDYTVVITDDDLDIPIEAQRISTFGANHCDGKRGSERLVAHELAHQWFGNSVTARQWSDIWLHEGFACYAEWLWSENSGGLSSDELANKYWKKLSTAAQDLIILNPGPEHMFDDRLYKRGALTLHNLRIILGDTNFFALLREWTLQNRHSTVVTRDFTELAARFSSTSLQPLWDQWLGEAKVPPLHGKLRP
ncbi:MAG: M1 family metallopeptidase [Mycobacteriaceae bacterium]